MTADEVLTTAQTKWATKHAKQVLLEKYKCNLNYLYGILSGNKRMPGWMLAELGIEKVKVVEYRRKS